MPDELAALRELAEATIAYERAEAAMLDPDHPLGAAVQEFGIAAERLTAASLPSAPTSSAAMRLEGDWASVRSPERCGAGLAG